MRSSCWTLVAAIASTLQAQAPTITPKLSVGCVTCGGPEQFGSIWDVSISAEGEILVTDNEAPMLRRFDAAGKSNWTGGAKGRGPGEFLLPIRSAFTPGGGMVVIDMANNRITDLGRDGRVTATAPLTTLATTSSVNAQGALVIGYDEMGRSFRVMGRRPGAGDLQEITRFPGSLKNKSVGLGPDGAIAVVLDGDRYEIARLDAAGHAQTAIARDLPRPRRSDVEEAEYRERMNRDMGMVAAEMKKAGGSGNARPISIPPAQGGLKAHIRVDGLRFDDAGRLWVHTLQGDETKTVFDVFGPTGEYLGAVTLPMRVSSFALGGALLAAAGEDADGTPVVRVWAVK